MQGPTPPSAVEGASGGAGGTRMVEARPPASSASVRARMQRTGRRDTAAERAVRSELHRRGLRYFVDRRVVPGTRRRVDIVFPRLEIAVFVDGCFWHSCPVHGTVPKANRAWWVAKLAANEARDRATDAQLEQARWTVLRFWEHEDPAVVADTIEAAVRSGGHRARRTETTSM